MLRRVVARVVVVAAVASGLLLPLEITEHTVDTVARMDGFAWNAQLARAMHAQRQPGGLGGGSVW